MQVTLPVFSLKAKRDRLLIRGECEGHERQVRRFVCLARGDGQRGGHLGVIKRRLVRAARGVKKYELDSFRAGVAIPETIVRQPRRAHPVEHKRGCIVSEELFGALVIGGGDGARRAATRLLCGRQRCGPGSNSHCRSENYKDGNIYSMHCEPPSLTMSQYYPEISNAGKRRARRCESAKRAVGNEPLSGTNGMLVRERQVLRR